jgi:SAM-dependent methyltransferase
VRRLAFTFWYLFKPPWDSGIPAPELVRAVAARPPGRALDLGCGTGTNVRYLAEHGWQVTGMDFAPNAISRARRKLRGLPATLLVGDVTRLEQLPLPGPFDLALDMGCFHSLSEEGRKRYAIGLKHWMKPGGLYLLYAWQPDPAHGVGGLPREEVVATFADGFTLANYEQGQGRPSAWYYFQRTDDR